MLGAAELLDAPASAQVTDGVTQLVQPRTQLVVDPTLPTDRALSASDDGRIVALDDTDDGSGALVVIDRVGSGGSGSVVAGVPPEGAHPTVSGNGCIVAYSLLDATGSSVELQAVDICSAPPSVLGIGSVAASAPLPAPAVSDDGGVIVWSTGDGLLRFERPSADYVPDADFAPDKPAARSFGSRLDLSADGTALVYETIADPDETDPAATSVHLWLGGDGDAGTSRQLAGPGARRPSISAAGDLIAYERLSTGPPQWNVELFDDTTPSTPRVLQVADDAWKPQLSADGHHLVFRQADGVGVTWWSTGAPFATASTVRALGPSPSRGDVASNSGPGATISANGRVILAVENGSVTVADPPTEPDGWYLWQHVREGRATTAPVDLGAIAVGETATGRVTFTNRGQVGIPLERADSAGTVTRFAPSADGAAVLGAWSCATTSVWQPGTSCTVDVSIRPTSPGTTTGTVTLVVPADPSTGATEVRASSTVTADGIAPTTTTTTTTTTSTTTTTTTTPPTTAPPSTLPTGTVPTRNALPLPSDPIFTGGGPYYNGSYGSAPGSYGGFPSSGSGSFESSTATAAQALPSFEPPRFRFPPTIVDAGRRTTEISLFNPGPDAVTVTAVTVEPPLGGAFVVESGGCTVMLSQERCTLTVTFAPIEVGPVETELVAQFDDGRRATAKLSGIGADEPTLTVEPDVAAEGQAVAVFGAGFPAGATITLSWNDGLVTSEHVVSEEGDFSESLVVLRHTPRGPTELLVPAQADLFADVTAELLVDHSGRRFDAVVLGAYTR